MNLDDRIKAQFPVLKGKNALALSRDLGMSHKACWIMLHKLREGMAAEFRGRKIGG